MLKEEALFFSQMIEKIGKENVFPMLNIGSSDEKANNTHPWMNEFIFEKYRKQGFEIFNIDLKSSDTVHFVGDINDKAFQMELKKIDFKSVMCANVVTCTPDSNAFTKSLTEILPKNGFLFYSCSSRYPYVADPVDTYYRPSLDDFKNLIARQAENLKLIEANSVESESLFNFMLQRPKSFLIYLLRLISPFYKPKTSFMLWKYLPNLFRPFATNCVIYKYN